MTAQRAKQLLKNALYRSIGETSSLLALNEDGATTLRVLMYHKINDIPDNPTTVPVSLFDEQLALTRDLGHTVVDLDAVLDHYVLRKPLPPNAVLITFDDGYRDIYENALPVLEKHSAPAVIFVPVAYMDVSMPLPHETHLINRGIRNPTLPKRTSTPSTRACSSRPATTSRSRRSHAATRSTPPRSGSGATTSSPTLRARSSSCSRARAT